MKRSHPFTGYHESGKQEEVKFIIGVQAKPSWTHGLLNAEITEPLAAYGPYYSGFKNLAWFTSPDSDEYEQPLALFASGSGAAYILDLLNKPLINATIEVH